MGDCCQDTPCCHATPRAGGEASPRRGVHLACSELDYRVFCAGRAALYHSSVLPNGWSAQGRP
jgi:hypothetical protein